MITIEKGQMLVNVPDAANFIAETTVAMVGFLEAYKKGGILSEDATLKDLAKFAKKTAKKMDIKPEDVVGRNISTKKGRKKVKDKVKQLEETQAKMKEIFKDLS